MKHSVKGAGRRSEFMAGTVIPVRHTEQEARFGISEGMMALAFIFGTVALMRLVLAVLGESLRFR
ncbi:MAG: hypothetical protein ACLQM8_06415 [Limisphaerales bacterium]|jgi:hypothetical protein